MRADATAWRGIADHDVVESPARQEVEVFKQLGDFGYIVVHRLYQQGPVALGKLAENGFVEWPMADLPRTVRAIFFHQPGFDALFAGEAGQLVRLQWTLEVGEGATNQ